MVIVNASSEVPAAGTRKASLSSIVLSIQRVAGNMASSEPRFVTSALTIMDSPATGVDGSMLRLVTLNCGSLSSLRTVTANREKPGMPNRVEDAFVVLPHPLGRVGHPLALLLFQSI